MTDPTPQDSTTPKPTKAVARRDLPPAMVAEIEARRMRAATATAVRSTQWGKDCSEQVIGAVTRYCVENGLDPMRHVEVLGGRIYLTETLYSEKAAPYVRAGLLIPEEPDLIQADARLDELAMAGDEWAKGERTRRMRLRIQHGVPEAAEGACVQRIRVATTGEVIIGVNWCGKGIRMQSKEIWEPTGPGGKRQPTGRFEMKDLDSVGGAEPVKTAITRARRRAWIQLLEGTSIDLGLRDDFTTLHQRAVQTNERIETESYEKAEILPPIGQKALPVPAPDEYGGNANPTTEVPAPRRIVNHDITAEGELVPPVTVGDEEPFA